MAPEAGIAPASPRLQRGANLPQLLREMVVRRGNAPRSLAYRASALLLSYRTEREKLVKAGFEVNSTSMPQRFKSLRHPAREPGLRARISNTADALPLLP